MSIEERNNLKVGDKLLHIPSDEIHEVVMYARRLVIFVDEDLHGWFTSGLPLDQYEIIK